jgi:hypothetical protein
MAKNTGDKIQESKAGEATTGDSTGSAGFKTFTDPKNPCPTCGNYQGQDEVSEPEQEQPTPPKTLPQLMGDITQDLLTALQGTDTGAKQRAIADGIRRLRIWYDAQPVDGRRELARASRKNMENFKLVAEQFFQEMMSISAQDAQ